MRETGAHYACAVIVQDGRILLGKRAPHRKAYAGCWDVIGGKVEGGESHHETLTRELGEEIGIAPLRPHFLDTLEDWRINAEAPPLYHFFKVAEWSGGLPRICNHEHTELKWFTRDEIARLPNLASPDYRSLFDNALSA